MHFFSFIFDAIINNWLVVAFVAPLLWALVNIIDAYFVNSVYRDEYDGATITGLFQLLPVVVLLFFVHDKTEFWSANFSNGSFNPALIFAFLAGFLYTCSYFFYFRALFKNSDVSLLQIIWSLTIVVVPLFTFLLWGEVLPMLKYLGMAVTLSGVIILSLSSTIRAKISSPFLWSIIWALILLSLGMTLSERAYVNLDNLGLGNQGFLIGFIVFSVGALMAGVVAMIMSKRDYLPLVRKYFKVFLILEIISFAGTFFSQRAIDIAPSVSYVATIETFLPIFVIIISAIILFCSIVFHFQQHRFLTIKRIHDEQLSGIWIKIIATIIMAIGVYIIS